MNHEQLRKILLSETISAVGCTEPAAIAYAAAVAAEHCRGKIRKIYVTLSPGVYKNAFSVGIPGTHEKGITPAVVLGALIKNSHKKLEILNMTNSEILKEKNKILEKNNVKINYNSNTSDFYIQVNIKTEYDDCMVIIEGGHTRIKLIEVNNKKIFSLSEKESNLKFNFEEISLKDLVGEATSMSIDELEFLLEGVENNNNIAEEGLKSKKDIGVGYGFISDGYRKILPKNFINTAKTKVAAACDARMSGVSLPVSTSFGSGNQGILITLSLDSLINYLNIPKEKLIKSLALAHLVNGFIKEKLGKLSPICGGAISAGAGVAAATCWSLGGKYDHIQGAIKNLWASAAGVFCDGAKGTCSFKLANACGEALNAAIMAANGIYVTGSEGIIKEDFEATLDNLVKVSKKGLKGLDDSIIKCL